MPVLTEASGRMPKQLKARWVACVVAVSFATLGIVFGWQAPSGVDRMSGGAPILEQGDFGRRQGELLSLKAALDRLDADANRTDPDNPSFRSLQTEQNAVMQRMREVARPLPAESLPRELRFLINDEPLAAVETMLLAAPDIATGGAAAPAELKVGLASASTAPDLALLSRDPELNLVILIERPHPTTKSTADNSTEPQPAKAPHGREPANGVPPQSLPAKKEVPFASPTVRGFGQRSVQW
jgi:hypothetical protein